MPEPVYFSFHYDRDIRRVAQVRNSWIIRPENTTQPFLDKAEWESIKRQGKTAIENWIEKELKKTSTTIVLIGNETYEREWVKHEIKRSHELGHAMLGIYIHNIKDPQTGKDLKGKNPFDNWSITRNGPKLLLSQIYDTYDWVVDDGYNNIEKWIKRAQK